MKLLSLSAFFLISLLPTFSYGQQISASEAKALQPDAMRLWERRADKSSLEEAISKFEMIQQGMPQDLEVLTILSRAYFLYGEFHLDDRDQKMNAFEKGKNFGLSGLMTNQNYAKLADKDIEKAIGALTEREVALTFWAAANLGKWSKTNGVMASLKYKDQMLAMVKKVESLKPDYFYAGASRFMGGFYALAPGIAGGDLKKSKKSFERSMGLAPEYLGTKVLYAESYLVEEEKEAEFKKVLEEVIAAPEGPKDIGPENTLEKQKAERLLSQIKKLF